MRTATNKFNPIIDDSETVIKFHFSMEEYFTQFLVIAHKVEEMFGMYSMEELVGERWKTFEKLNGLLDHYEVMTMHEHGVEPWGACEDLGEEYRKARDLYRRHCNIIYKNDYYQLLKDLGDAPEGVKRMTKATKRELGIAFPNRNKVHIDEVMEYCSYNTLKECRKLADAHGYIEVQREE